MTKYTTMPDYAHIPPPPPFPPGDPRLVAPQGWASAPPAFRNPYQAQPAPAANTPGRRPTVALAAGIGAVVIVGVAIVASVLNPARNVAAPPPAHTYAQPSVPTGDPAKPAVPLPPAPTKGIDLGTSPSLNVALPKLEAYVEKARGHRFLKPVTVTPLADKAFLAALNKGEKPTPAEVAANHGSSLTLKALHLVPRDTDLAKAMAAQQASDVGGFYDPRTKRLYVRSAKLNPLAQVIVVHELTHALDDQYFDLAKLQRRAKSGDEDEAITSLIEGDARSVEDRFRAALVPAERKQVAAEEAAQYGPAEGTTPKFGFLDLYQAFPYELGAVFVKDIRAGGGAAAVDAAFRRPPISTLEVLAPTLFLQHRSSVMVFGKVTKSSKGTIVDQDNMGALGIAAVLSEADPRKALSESSAGYWGGDHYVTTTRGNRTCVTDRIEATSPLGRGYLLGSLTVWTQTHPGSSAIKGPTATSIVLTSCIG